MRAIGWPMAAILARSMTARGEGSGREKIRRVLSRERDPGQRAGELGRDHDESRREGDPDGARRAAAAPENHGERRRIGGLQKKLRHQPRVAPDDAPLLDAQGRAGARAKARRPSRCGAGLNRRARSGDRHAREALAEQHAGERKDDGPERCPDEHRVRVGSRRAHRRPQEALRLAMGIADGARAVRIAVRMPSGSIATTCAPSTADAPTAVAAIWPKRRALAGPSEKTGPSIESSRSPCPRARRQARPDRAPANADGP